MSSKSTIVRMALRSMFSVSTPIVGLVIVAWSISTSAGTPSNHDFVNFQALITDSSDNPQPNMVFPGLEVAIVDSDSNCFLYVEGFGSTGTDTKGMIAVALGKSGTMASGITSFDQIFQSGVTVNTGGCLSGGLSNGAGLTTGVGRQLQITLDGSTWVVASDIGAVPFASEADNATTLQGYGPSSFIQSSGSVTQSNVSSLFSSGTDASSNGWHHHDSRYARLTGGGVTTFSNDVATTGKLAAGTSTPATGTNLDVESTSSTVERMGFASGQSATLDFFSNGAATSRGKIVTDDTGLMSFYSGATPVMKINGSGVSMGGSLALAPWTNAAQSANTAGWTTSQAGNIWFNTSNNALTYWDNAGTIQQIPNAGSVLNTALASGKIYIGNGSGVATPLAISGDATLSNAGAMTLNNTSVTGQTLAGLSMATGGTISSSDSILSGLGKLQNQVTTNTASLSSAVLKNGSVAFTGNQDMGGNSLTGVGAVVFKDSSANTVTLKAPSTVTSPYTLTLPAASGTTGQALGVTGPGTLGWITPSLPALTSGNIWVGNGSSTATAVTMSGDATMTNTGAVTLTNSSVTGQALTGLNVATAGTVTTTDTILTGLGKLQNQLVNTATSLTSVILKNGSVAFTANEDFGFNDIINVRTVSASTVSASTLLSNSVSSGNASLTGNLSLSGNITTGSGNFTSNAPQGTTAFNFNLNTTPFTSGSMFVVSKQGTSLLTLDNTGNLSIGPAASFSSGTATIGSAVTLQSTGIAMGGATSLSVGSGGITSTGSYTQSGPNFSVNNNFGLTLTNTSGSPLVDLTVKDGSSTRMLIQANGKNGLGNVTSPNATLHIMPWAVGDQAFIITEMSGQTGAPFQVQNSSLSALVTIDANGYFQPVNKSSSPPVVASFVPANDKGKLWYENGNMKYYDGTAIQTLPTTATAGTVTGVTATAPLSSSGGTAPNISLTGTVGMTNGGTGSSLTAANHAMVYSGASGLQLSSGSNFYYDDSSGSVGLGSSSPSAKLDIKLTTDGANAVTIRSADGSANWILRPENSADVNSGSLYLVRSAGSGDLILPADPTQSLGASTRQYVNSTVSTSAGNLMNRDGSNSLGTFASSIGDGASSVAFTMQPSSTYVTSGAKLLALQNGGAAVFAVDKDGNLWKNSARYLSADSPNANLTIGQSSGTNMSGTGNTLVGQSSGSGVTSGQYNTFMGNLAGGNYTSGNFNTGVGAQALLGLASTASSLMTAVGYEAGQYILGTRGTFIGAYAGQGYNNGSSTGTDNTAIGAFSGYDLTYGAYNTLVGSGAGYVLQSGSYNTIIGDNAGVSESAGSDNTFVGDNAGYSHVNGNDATLIGSDAGHSLTANYNTFVGSSSGYYVTTGTDNVIVGDFAGDSLTTGTENTVVGSGADAGATVTNSISLGYLASVQANNAIQIGTGTNTTANTTRVNNLTLIDQNNNVHGLNAGLYYGVTSTNYTGSFTYSTYTGYQAGQMACANQYGSSAPNIHLCTGQEILMSAMQGVSMPTGQAWYASGVPISTYPADCSGFTSASGQAVAWTPGSKSGTITSCSTALPIACCR